MRAHLLLLVPACDFRADGRLGAPCHHECGMATGKASAAVSAAVTTSCIRFDLRRGRVNPARTSGRIATARVTGLGGPGAVLAGRHVRERVGGP